VIVDVYYDHFLARQWDQFHPMALEVFAQQVYRTISKHDAILPGGVRYMLPYMIGGNWLSNYAAVEGIGRALSGMARRTPYQSKMEQAVVDLTTHYDAFRGEFLAFFPLLKAHVAQYLAVK
ncbi:MAG TPA: acyl carrier protein phosphodiesterase, partial [Chryseosolibacter sp.]|nr:acyl carrier protein phosphodiesterase [Chryseosolibacter sp.]